MKVFNNGYSRFALTLFVVAAFCASAFGQKLAVSTTKGGEAPSAVLASVTPVVFNNNPGCQALNALHVNGVGDIRFSHIIHDYELKLDFGTPNGTFAFATGNGVQVSGPQHPSQSVTVSSTNSTLNSWSSTIQITAVILKVGNQSYVYPYKPFSHGDTNLATGSQNAISHLTFCYGDATNPTAGEATISGQVTDASGLGIAKAQLILVNGSTGETKITMTNPFGYYRFDGLDVNELYVLNVSHKRYAFAEKQKTISVMDDFAEVQFVALPPQQ